MACKISELMTETVASLDATTDIQEAACFMAKHNHGSILVSDAGKVVGLFTERDLLTRVIGAKKDPNEHTLGEMCTRDLISVSQDSSCQDAIRLMQINNCRRLLVYRQENLQGLISISSLAQELAEHRKLKNTAVNLVGGLTLTVVLVVIAMLIAILPDMLIMAEQAMR